MQSGVRQGWVAVEGAICGLVGCSWGGAGGGDCLLSVYLCLSLFCGGQALLVSSIFVGGMNN